MSDFDVGSDEMRRYSNIDDRDVERLLAGHAPDDDADLAEVARFFQDLGEAFPERSTETCEQAHVAAMIETAHLLAEQGDPVVRPASKAYGPGDQASGLPKWRRNPMFQKLIASKWSKVAAVALALSMAFGGVAFAGVLPAPIQDAVAGAAQQVGIELPHTADASVDETGDVQVNDADDGSVEETADVPAGAVDNEQVGNEDQGSDEPSSGIEADDSRGDVNDADDRGSRDGAVNEVDEDERGDSNGAAVNDADDSEDSGSREVGSDSSDERAPATGSRSESTGDGDRSD